MLMETRVDAKDDAILKIKLTRKVKGQLEVIEKLQALTITLKDKLKIHGDYCHTDDLMDINIDIASQSIAADELDDKYNNEINLDELATSNLDTGNVNNSPMDVKRGRVSPY